MSQWVEETIFNDGDAFFDRFFQAIAEANQSIKIESYIFDLDALGLKVIQALTDASNRGVHVRLLLDGAGCSEWGFEDAKKYRKKNFEIQFFHPLSWQRKRSRFFYYFNWSKLSRGFSLLNHRNHRKIFLVDQNLAFTGSFNISARHLKSVAAENTWRDTGVLIRGDQVKVLHESFDEAWNYFNNYIFRYLRKKKVATSGMPLLMMNRTIRQRRESYHHLLQKIFAAKHQILITNPYFIPTARLRRALHIAIRKGVEVIAIFPKKSDFFGVKYAMQSHYSSLLRSGIHIYEYEPSMIHSKVLITDDRAMIGSSNMNSRSLLLDLEVDVEITRPENIAAIREQFFEDLKHSTKIDRERWKKRSWVQKFLESVFFLFRWVL